MNQANIEDLNIGGIIIVIIQCTINVRYIFETVEGWLSSKSILSRELKCAIGEYWIVKLANDIYISEGFDDYFEKFSGRENRGIFPTVQVRKLMWALRMKPLPREFWEKDF